RAGFLRVERVKGGQAIDVAAPLVECERALDLMGQARLEGERIGAGEAGVLQATLSLRHGIIGGEEGLGRLAHEAAAREERPEERDAPGHVWCDATDPARVLGR